MLYLPNKPERFQRKTMISTFRQQNKQRTGTLSDRNKNKTTARWQQPFTEVATASFKCQPFSISWTSRTRPTRPAGRFPTVFLGTPPRAKPPRESTGHSVDLHFVLCHGPVFPFFRFLRHQQHPKDLDCLYGLAKRGRMKWNESLMRPIMRDYLCPGAIECFTGRYCVYDGRRKLPARKSKASCPAHFVCSALTTTIRTAANRPHNSRRKCHSMGCKRHVAVCSRSRYMLCNSFGITLGHWLTFAHEFA